MHQAEVALARGWKVSVVAQRLTEELQGRVDWLKLYVPPRGFALQWLTAEKFIRHALNDPKRFDLVLTHQPQARKLSHIFQCHFLTRAAYKRNCLIDGNGLKSLLEWFQKRLVLSAEDRIFRNWPPDTTVLFNSALTQANFESFYKRLPNTDVLLYQNPQWSPIEPRERESARASYGIPTDKFVVGFLGGLQTRKGLSRLIPAMQPLAETYLLMGGLHSRNFYDSRLDNRMLSLGLVEDTAKLYAACDAFVVPSVFEPYGYVACEGRIQRNSSYL